MRTRIPTSQITSLPTTLTGPSCASRTVGQRFFDWDSFARSSGDRSDGLRRSSSSVSWPALAVASPPAPSATAPAAIHMGQKPPLPILGCLVAKKLEASRCVREAETVLQVEGRSVALRLPPLDKTRRRGSTERAAGLQVICPRLRTWPWSNVSL